MLKKIFTAILLLTAVSSVQAQVPELIRNKEFRQDARAAVDSLYNFNAAAANEILAEWKQKYPDHPLWKLFDAMTVWWQVLSDLERDTYDEKLVKLMKEADRAATKLLHQNSSHADALIIKAVANGYLARHYANHGEWLTSIKYGRKALKAYRYLQEVIPHLPDLKLAKGLKLYYLAYLPQAYPVIKAVSWMLPDGNQKKGLRLLKEASRQAIFADAEATYFLGNIYFNYEHEPRKALKYFKRLHRTYPNNNYYARLLVHTYYQVHKYEKALALIEDVLNRWEKRELPFGKIVKQELYYRKGRIYMQRRNFEKAADFLVKSVEAAVALPQTKQRQYYAAAAYYAGKAFLRLGKRQKAVHYLRLAAASKTDGNYKDSAQQQLEKLSD